MLERIIEKALFSSRWILAPVYLGLSLALLALAVVFFMEVAHVVPILASSTDRETSLVLHVLALVDLALVGSLIVMVMFSGYENFVSKLDVAAEESDKLAWLGRLDAGTLKLKVASSIVAISSIHLLKKFMEVPSIDESDLMWYVLIHLTFVLSAFAMAMMERLHRH